jgi:hypothetical protein
MSRRHDLLVTCCPALVLPLPGGHPKSSTSSDFDPTKSQNQQGTSSCPALNVLLNLDRVWTGSSLPFEQCRPGARHTSIPTGGSRVEGITPCRNHLWLELRGELSPHSLERPRGYPTRRPDRTYPLWKLKTTLPLHLRYLYPNRPDLVVASPPLLVPRYLGTKTPARRPKMTTWKVMNLGHRPRRLLDRVRPTPQRSSTRPMRPRRPLVH